MICMGAVTRGVMPWKLHNGLCPSPALNSIQLYELPKGGPPSLPAPPPTPPNAMGLGQNLCTGWFLDALASLKTMFKIK